MPLVVVLLFFVFGGVVAAFLPGIIGGLTIAGALGIMRLTALSVPVHYFAQPVVTLIGLGIAIDYGLFVVSRFREEIAEGYDTETAVRRTVMTAGRTIAFSSVLISASVGGLLLFPQGFLKSLTYAMIASVTLAAMLSITVLPAILGMLGPKVDALSVTTLLQGAVPAGLEVQQLDHHLAGRQAGEDQDPRRGRERVLGQAGRPRDETAAAVRGPDHHRHDRVDSSAGQIWPSAASAKSTCRRTNSVRQAQEEFDRTFPGFRIEPITLVMQSTDGRPVTDAEVAQVRSEALGHPGIRRAEQRPGQHVEGTTVPRRGVQRSVRAGHSERVGEPTGRQGEGRCAEGDPDTTRSEPVGGRHARTRTGQRRNDFGEAAADGPHRGIARPRS